MKLLLIFWMALVSENLFAHGNHIPSETFIGHSHMSEASVLSLLLVVLAVVLAIAIRNVVVVSEKKRNK